VDIDKKVIAAYNVIDPSDPNIARAATYIINQEGRIASKFLDAVGNRTGPDHILAELNEL